jgi:hypothetical protein
MNCSTRWAASPLSRPTWSRCCVRHSALVGSKYVAVVDGRLTASALIEDCERLTRHHTGIPEPAKDALLAALRACHEANKERSRVIHDTWATRPGSVMVTLQGGRKSHGVTVTPRTLAELRQLADQVARWPTQPTN